MDVVFTSKAVADLVAIGDFIAEHNPARAATFLAELIGRCEELADIPSPFRCLPHIGTGISGAGCMETI